ncbi:peptide chain release factor N(5)-glutamine methyltransferase [Raineyella sp. LH-20]|uniref:peptide chain release factor N(5)-glutamine methyltransferase n=1 Tax=Raineyella sp. LH-20 TaxID=3081204 RepID=UPI00295441D2|nr:peptide chain release factor N(5)-glutamine methyltransferase [Raineyella sp. LH-20]WOP17917.1 peptide chain release factor N(5)-glutamine methyltransferase [Raineyella sp. LH-20]
MPDRPSPVRATVVARRGADRLRGHVASPEVDARLLLAHLLGVRPGDLVMADPPSAERLEHYRELLERRAAGVPLQHLTGEAWFRTVRLAVGPGVFVPRPETELVAGAAIEAARAVQAQGRTPRVVELCAGSGAISAALVDEAPGCRVVAVEIDPAAVEWTRRNLAGTGVEVRLGDLADAVPEWDGTVDVVVVNPPYVPSGISEALPVEVTGHDPAIAVFSGADGLDAIRAVERTARRLLRPGGVLVCEHDDSQGLSAPAIFSGVAWRGTVDHPDLSGRPRFVSATRTQVAG